MESTFQEVAELWLGNIRCRVKESTDANVVRKHLMPGKLRTYHPAGMVRRESGQRR